ncbi:hypothetical protein T4D_4805 [Trichinella pseudospiralis]|uniref:Uncharacterized protein n=1 Tax=Trichinella pseudospiralis TaxID=6337 RepID=A0A0V1FFM0_TRIPS|nr:hypothetical protein T4D_4805 [Trichinella pseudospiralis]
MSAKNNFGWQKTLFPTTTTTTTTTIHTFHSIHKLRLFIQSLRTCLIFNYKLNNSDDDDDDDDQPFQIVDRILVRCVLFARDIEANVVVSSKMLRHKRTMLLVYVLDGNWIDGPYLQAVCPITKKYRPWGQSD